MKTKLVHIGIILLLFSFGCEREERLIKAEAKIEILQEQLRKAQTAFADREYEKIEVEREIKWLEERIEERIQSTESSLTWRIEKLEDECVRKEKTEEEKEAEKLIEQYKYWP